MALAQNNVTRSYAAGADFTSARYSLVKLSAADTVVVASSRGEAVLGPAMDNVASGAHVEVSRMGFGKVELGGTVALMDPLTTDAAGKAIKATLASDTVFGYAEAAGVDGDVITAFLTGPSDAGRST